MKILWFTNSPCGAAEKLTGKPQIGGGWLIALSEQLLKSTTIDLHIAFYWGVAMPAFEYKGITYHPVLRDGDSGKFGRMINRYKKAHGDALSLRELPRLLAVVSGVRPDLIHIHGSEENFGLIAKEKLPCLVVLSIQGLLSPIFNKWYSGFSKADISKNEGLFMKLICSGISMSEKDFQRRAAMERDFFKFIPYVVGRTSWDKSCSLALNPQRQYFEVGEILRSEFFSASWKKTSFGSPFTLVSTISNGIYKGMESIFNSASILVDAGFSFQWNIIGASTSSTEVKLSEKLIGKKAADLHLNFLGRKTASEMIDVLLQSDTYVQVSHIENSPNSLCEAMLLGMPCIATFAGGTASMLEKNVEGRLVQDGDPYAMAGMIMEMAADFNQAKVFGQKAAERAAKRHKPEHVCQQLMNVYKEILDK